MASAKICPKLKVHIKRNIQLLKLKCLSSYILSADLSHATSDPCTCVLVNAALYKLRVFYNTHSVCNKMVTLAKTIL